jgi:hypothetical protein
MHDEVNCFGDNISTIGKYRWLTWEPVQWVNNGGIWNFLLIKGLFLTWFFKPFYVFDLIQQNNIFQFLAIFNCISWKGFGLLISLNAFSILKLDRGFRRIQKKVKNFGHDGSIEPIRNFVLIMVQINIIIYLFSQFYIQLQEKVLNNVFLFSVF